jgi:hypothetical protein
MKVLVSIVLDIKATSDKKVLEEVRRVSLDAPYHFKIRLLDLDDESDWEIYDEHVGVRHEMD